MATPKMTENFAEFPDEHANRHKLGKDGGRDSLAHMIMLPEHGIAGWMYPTVTWDGQAKGAACVFGSGVGEFVLEESTMQVPASLDFYDFNVGHFHMAIREPHKTVDLAWKGDRIKMDFRYEGLHPVYAFSTKEPGVPPYFGNDRTEQHGRLTGNLEIDGKKIAVDSLMIRDHSWGPRIWGLNQHYKWFHATTGDVCIHFYEMQSFGRLHQQGYVYKDGAMHQIVAIEHKYQFDERMMHQSVQVTVTDTAGRSVSVDCKTFASTELKSYDPMIQLNEAALTCTIEGKAGVGWAEFCWNRNYLEYARDYVAKYS
ncbi:MAG: hypothetical protein AB7U63_07835 [Porticoccaceae bacterium]